MRTVPDGVPNRGRRKEYDVGKHRKGVRYAARRRALWVKRRVARSLARAGLVQKVSA